MVFFMMQTIINLMEAGLAPDALIRTGIRVLNRKRLHFEYGGGREALGERQRALMGLLRRSPIAVLTHAANEQHYELPPEFFQRVLGSRMKYSCCLYPSGAESLDEAEEAMLGITCERAQVRNGTEILELGCGWGSLTLWMAEKYPGTSITAVSNSVSQRKFIEARCHERGIGNIRVITSDMNHFSTDCRYDLVVSIEMFEHMRNYDLLFEKISRWMKPNAKLFLHIFCHKDIAYLFDTEGADNWIGRYFFSGGMMPSDNLLLCFQDHLVLEDHWRVSGTHYQRTAEHWLRNLDGAKETVVPILESAYGKKDAGRWFRRWRIFFMACAELWGFRGGREWGVAHYLFRRRGA